MYQSLSLSLSIYICKNGLDPDQTRIEFRKECFVNLKICACDRKYAKCRTKADAHDKMGFLYLNKCIHCPVLCVDPAFNVGPAKRHLKVFCWRTDDGPLLVIFGSSLP